MKALVKKQARQGLWLQDVAEPEIGINDVLVKIARTAICGTDVHIYEWDQWARKTIKTPLVIGHEFVGTVAQTGENVSDYKPGDLVSGEGHVVCGRCRNCLAGRRHLCRDPKGIGIDRDGAFAEYLSLPVTNVWYCDKDIPTDVLSCFDPLGNAVHTAGTYNVVGEDVLITGAGPIGCMATAVARQIGARYVVVTDVNPYRLEMAKKMGASLTVDVRTESIAGAQKKLGMKEGFDVGMEMSGSPDALRDMLGNMAHGGKIALLGLLPSTEIDWSFVVFNGLTIKGIYGRKMYETWYKVTMLIQSGLDIEPVITHRFGFADFEAGFEAMRSGQSGKVILNWTN